MRDVLSETTPLNLPRGISNAQFRKGRATTPTTDTEYKSLEDDSIFENKNYISIQMDFLRGPFLELVTKKATLPQTNIGKRSLKFA